ncbi:MAG: hypothetical protein H0U59_00155 [Gemmatimonadaceae bacterium]|nr:hypothetical protein [Gemmatimonadaceae bacterium]MDQ3243162.1 hypothetical protein [Gemmatimonadota bacterium]
MSQRRGFALALSIVAIVIIAALAAGVLFASGQEARIGRSELMDQKVFAFAERLANDAVAEFDIASRDSMPPGTVISYAPPAAANLDGTVFITRLDSSLFQVVAEAKATSGNTTELKRRVGITLRVQRPDSLSRRALRVGEQAWVALHEM